VLVTGNTSSTGWPLTPDAYDRSLSGAVDAFLTELDTSACPKCGLASLLYSTYLGGNANEKALGVATAPAGTYPEAWYVAGQTFSLDFPVVNTTPPATWQQGGGDVFIVRLIP